MSSNLERVELEPMYHCHCGRFYIMPFLRSDKTLCYQIKDFIGGGCCVYLQETFEKAKQYVVDECACCKNGYF